MKALRPRSEQNPAKGKRNNLSPVGAVVYDFAIRTFEHQKEADARSHLRASMRRLEARIRSLAAGNQESNPQPTTVAPKVPAVVLYIIVPDIWKGSVG